MLRALRSLFLVWLGLVRPSPDARELELVAALERASLETGVVFRYLDLERAWETGGDLPAGHDRLEDRVARIVTELLRYPEPLRRSLVDEVWLEDSLATDGIEWSGRAHCPRAAFSFSLTTGRRSTVHHEIAHLAYCHPDFPRERWAAISDGYGAEAKVAVVRAGGARIAPELFEAGFLTQYATTEPTEDVAELAEVLLVMPLALDAASARQERIRDKRDLLLDFYTEASPGWDLWSSAGPGPGPGPGPRRGRIGLRHIPDAVHQPSSHCRSPGG